MPTDLRPKTDGLQLPTIRLQQQPTVADQVFDVLHQRILSLELPPATRISEADIARKMDVSRQPVREAFKRLEKLGFLRIRPQSSTSVTLISEEAVQRACFIRTALEAHTCRTACLTVDEAGLSKLEDLIDGQEAAVADGDRDRFHALDDLFHREICVQAKAPYAWDMIHDIKGHMDRIRLLSLDEFSRKHALDEHILLFRAIRRRDPDAAAAAITKHLDRIQVLVEEVKAMDHSWFEVTPS